VPSELLKEIRKLEVRLEDYIESEEKFIRDLRDCIKKLKELNEEFEKINMNSSSERYGNLSKLRLEVIRAFTETLKSQGEVEHEKSHLLESYGAIILSLEEFKRYNL